MKRWLKWVMLFCFGLVLVFIAFIVSLQDFQLKNIDPENPPRFIEADFVDLSKIYTISKYRSGIGHSTDDSVEKCRSLRHIFGGQGKDEFKNAEEKWNKMRFQPNENDSIAIYSPVNGLITDLSGRRYEDTSGIGQTIVIKPDNAPGYKVRLDSIFLDSNLKPLTRVKAGQRIGSICTQCPGEVYVYYSHITGEKAVSYIDVLSDKVFSAYQARGLKNREDAIISREYRDSHSFQCADSNDPTSGILDHPEMHDVLASFVILSGYKEPRDDKK